MDSIFKISKSGTYGISIDGLETDNLEYLSEVDPISVSIRTYAYSQTVTINNLVSIASSGVETPISYSINTHNTPGIDSSVFTVSKDGLYLISHIILPTREWFDYAEGLVPNNSDNYTIVYYYNSSDGYFYKYANLVHTQVSLAEILSANYAQPAVGSKGTTIIRSDKNTFIMYFLNDCFAKLCKNILTALPSCSKSTELKAMIDNRDLLWMAINVIKYEIEMVQLYEAQRFLEEISWCGLCNNVSSLTGNSLGCGCNN